MNGTDVRGSSTRRGSVRSRAFWSEDLLISFSEDELPTTAAAEEEESMKSLTQARDNLLQFVVVAVMLFSISRVYLMIFNCYSRSCWEKEGKERAAPAGTQTKRGQLLTLLSCDYPSL